MTFQRHLALAATLCAGIASAPHALANGGASSTLVSNEILFPGQTLVSDSCFYHLDMQTDGNLVVYEGEGRGFPIWSSRANALFGVAAGSYASLQADGNFVEYDLSSDVEWKTDTSRFNQFAELWMQDDGNLVLYSAGALGSSPLWASNTARGDIPGYSPCSMTSFSTQIEVNTNMIGDDYANWCTNSYEQCGTWCAANDAECNGWTFVPAGTAGSCSGSEGRCWLKYGTPTTSYAVGMVTGIIKTDRVGSQASGSNFPIP